MQRDHIALQHVTWQRAGVTPQLSCVMEPELLHSAWATSVFSVLALGCSRSSIRLCTRRKASLEYHTPQGSLPAPP